MKICEIINNESINKIYQDNNGDLWRVTLIDKGLVLVMNNVGSMRLPITKMYHLDEMFRLEFEEYFPYKK